MTALGSKYDPVDLSYSPTPPKREKQDDIMNNPIASGIEYYRVLSSKLGTKARYDVNEEIVFFLPAFAAIGHYVDRIGIVESSDRLGNYRVIDKKDPCMRYTVNWNLICKTEQTIGCNLDSLHNDNESANLSIAISPFPSKLCEFV